MNMKVIIGLVFTATLLLGAVLYNSEEPVTESSGEAVQSYKLSNGMKVLVMLLLQRRYGRMTVPALASGTKAMTGVLVVGSFGGITMIARMIDISPSGTSWT